jgi:hypothetical protein
MQFAEQSRSDSSKSPHYSVQKTVLLSKAAAAVPATRRRRRRAAALAQTVPLAATAATAATAAAAAPQIAASQIAAPAVAMTDTAAVQSLTAERRARPAPLSPPPVTSTTGAAIAAAVVPAQWHELLSVDDDDDDVASDVVSYVSKRSLDLQLLETIMHAGCLLKQFKKWQQQLQAPFANTTVTIGSTLYALAYWRRHYAQQQNTALEAAVEQLKRVLEHCRALRTDNSSSHIAGIAVHKIVLQEWRASVLQDSHRARGRLQQVCIKILQNHVCVAYTDSLRICIYCVSPYCLFFLHVPVRA